MMSEITDERPELEEKLSELDILRQSLDQAKAKEKEVYEQLIRLAAEFENFRKKTEARIAEARRYGREDVLLGILPLTDALHQAESAVKDAKDTDSLKKGLALMAQQFDKFLKDQGLVPIKSLGEKLDPHRHEAVAQEVNDEKEDNLIVGEIQRGYTLEDRVVRPARVRVSTKPKETSPSQ